MAVALIFFLGIANFAMHKAVMESRHPLVLNTPWMRSEHGRRIALVLEFTVLLAAMLLAGHGWPSLAIAYLIYSGLNALTSWLILSGRN